MATNKKSDQEKPENFLLGLLISVICWVLDGVFATYFYSWLVHSPNRPTIMIIWTMFIPLIIFLSLVWIPVTTMASIRIAKKGIKSSATLLVVTSILAPFIMAYVAWYLVALLGGY